MLNKNIETLKVSK